MELDAILSVVEELNLEIDQYEDISLRQKIEFISDGYTCTISFLNFDIWSSIDDDRDFDELTNEYEHLNSFLKIRCNAVIEQLQKQKFVFAQP